MLPLPYGTHGSREHREENTYLLSGVLSEWRLADMRIIHWYGMVHHVATNDEGFFTPRLFWSLRILGGGGDPARVTGYEKYEDVSWPQLR